MKRLIVLLAACSPPTTSATQSLDLSQPWTRHVITATTIGADGVDLKDVNGDGRLDVTTAWEEGHSVTVSYHPNSDGDVRALWPTTVIASNVVGVEDAKFMGDLDGDGHEDIASASDGNQRVYLHFANATGWTTVDVTASHAHNRWMQLAAADVDGDGLVDVVGGSRQGSYANPAVIAWFKNPGATLARTASAWTYHQMTLAGWTMSLLARDVDGDGDPDFIVSDRSYTLNADGTHNFALFGARWIENAAGSFVNHTIAQTSNLGDEMFLTLADWNGDGITDVIDGQSSSTKANRIAINLNDGGWATWTQQLVEPPNVPTVGHYQGNAIGDLDGDGLLDVAVSTNIANTCCNSTLSGVYWLHNNGDGTFSRGEISGPTGTKFDNIVLTDVDGDGDLDTVDSEQVDNLGVVWYENPNSL